MIIVRFQAENVKKLKVVEITPEGNVVVIGGKNCAGKSAVLESIMAALAGKKKLPPKMLREGAKKGFIELDLGDIMVKRTFTKSGNSSLKVFNKGGAVFSSPQKMLDKLLGNIAFDPLEFSRMSTKEQIEVLKQITGLDFSKLDQKREELYNQRAEVNRDGKRLSAECESIEQQLPDEIPKSEVSVVQLMSQLDAAQATNKANDELRCEFELTTNRIEELRAQYELIGQQIVEETQKQKSLHTAIKKAKNVDIDAIKQQLKSAESNNRVFHLNIKYNELMMQLKQRREQYKELTRDIKDIDRTKEERLENSNLPVDNLTFDDNGVMLNGLPFEQASSSEQLRVSVAIGLAMNPKLKVLLIKDGSLLDEDNLKLISEMAEEADAQLWIERVGIDSNTTVIMEDGNCKDC